MLPTAALRAVVFSMWLSSNNDSAVALDFWSKQIHLKFHVSLMLVQFVSSIGCGDVKITSILQLAVTVFDMVFAYQSELKWAPYFDEAFSLAHFTWLKFYPREMSAKASYFSVLSEARRVGPVDALLSCEEERSF